MARKRVPDAERERLAASVQFSALAQGAALRDSRTCFAVMYFTDEATADLAGAASRDSGNTYNGGIFHGMKCGRDKSHDYVDANGVRLYAVTH